MEKYLLSDSFLAYIREKFPYELYEDDYSLFEKSIESKESLIILMLSLVILIFLMLKLLKN